LMERGNQPEFTDSALGAMEYYFKVRLQEARDGRRKWSRRSRRHGLADQVQPAALKATLNDSPN
jgi:hypothetical protein